MDPEVTVLIPTHDHGRTLTYSIATVLTQTVSNLEVFVIGDGVPDVTRALMSEFMDRDDRIRFFDHPKGPRNGEIYRAEALQEARGRIVCYQSDDDLWLPNHLEYMIDLLGSADFAHALPVIVEPDGSLRVLTVDLTSPFYRNLLQSGINRIPLCCGCHTREMYGRLPHGWRTAPEDTYSDLYMWQQFLSLAQCRTVSGWMPTVLHFPSPDRTHLSPDERVKELKDWSDKLINDSARNALVQELLEFCTRGNARMEIKASERNEKLSRLRRNLDRARVAEREASKRQIQTRELEDQLIRIRSKSAYLEDQLIRIRSSSLWKVRTILLRVPSLSPLVRWVAKVLTRSSGT